MGYIPCSNQGHELGRVADRALFAIDYWDFETVSHFGRIETIEEQWRSPDGTFFRVQTSEESDVVLRHNEVQNQWTSQIDFDSPACRIGEYARRSAENTAGQKRRLDHCWIKVAPFDRNAVAAGIRHTSLKVIPSADEPEVSRFVNNGNS
jgi:hypothetical protein